MTDKFEYKKVNKQDIDYPLWLPRIPLGKMRDEESLEFTDSIKGTGLINPITLRAKNNGRYDLIAGSRRIDATIGDIIEAKVIYGASDFECMMICLAENMHRKDIDYVDRDMFIYNVYVEGLKEKKIENIKDYSKLTGKNVKSLNKIILSGEERSKLSNKNNNLIQHANTNALYATRSLTPAVRNKLLDLDQKKMIYVKTMPDVVRHVKTYMEKGVSEKNVIKMIELVAPKAPEIKVDKTETNDVSVSVLDPKKLESVGEVVTTVPEDVQEKVVNNKISLETAKEIGVYSSKAARDQVLKEKEQIQKWKVDSASIYDKEWEKTRAIRKQQDDEMQASGSTKLKTIFDTDTQKRLTLLESKDRRHDLEYIKRYENIRDEIMNMIAIYHPRKVIDDNNKIIVKELIKEVYDICRDVLIDLGDIKESTEKSNRDTGRVSNKNKTVPNTEKEIIIDVD